MSSRKFWLESHSGATLNLAVNTSFLQSFSALGRKRTITTSQVGNWMKVTDIIEQFEPITLDCEIAFIEDPYANLIAFLDFYHKDVRASSDINQRLKLYYQPEDADLPIYAYVDIAERDYSQISSGYHRVKVALALLSPWIQDTVYTLNNTGDITIGTPYPYTYEMSYGQVIVSGEIDEVFVNDGDDDAVYTLQIIGPTANPKYTIGNKTVMFNEILTDGEQIYVDATPNTSTIELNGEYNDQIFNPLKSLPWFTIPRGLIPIQIRATGGLFILTIKKVILDARKF